MRFRLYLDGELVDEESVTYDDPEAARTRAEEISIRQRRIADASPDKPLLVEVYDSETDNYIRYGDDAAGMVNPQPLPADEVAKLDQLTATARDRFTP